MELRTTSARGSDTSCRGLVNQVSSRRGRQADRRKAAAPSQASARQVRVNGTAAMLPSQSFQASHSQAPQQVAPVQPNMRSGQEQPAQQICEAYNLDTFLKERDACGVGFIANLRHERMHKILSQAVTALTCMEHRGACSADQISGDGAGIMTQIPWDMFKQEFPDLNEQDSGVGMLFMPNDDKHEADAKQIIEDTVKAEGRCKIVGWRDVPVDSEVVGRFARVTQPRIKQVFLEHTAGATGEELEREMFILRKVIEKAKFAKLKQDGMSPLSDFYICTMSSKTICYKGMLQSAALGMFYKDLQNEAYTTAFAMYHRRFSTNTTPKWPLAQPMRFMGHNGEINTLQGNLNWVSSREHSLTHPVWEGREDEFLPICNQAESDSANLDHLAEYCVRTGVDANQTLMMLVPEAYQNHPTLLRNYPEVIDFYEYYEGLQEGWDGPALLVFSDGNKIGARLDRNGLRPARFWETDDGMVYVASEVGVLGDVLSNAKHTVRKGRLGPGQMVCADLADGTFKIHAEIAKEVATAAPYKEWVNSNHRLEDLVPTNQYLQETQMELSQVLRLQAANGLGQEDSGMIIEGMAQQGAEPTYCMGDDIPLAVLSDKPHMLYNYFKQRFAQVTNPPIDPLREGLVMSMTMRLGKRGNLLQPGADAYSQVLLKSPMLLESELKAITSQAGLMNETFNLHYESGKPGALRAALDALCKGVEAAVRKGCELVVLSDRISEEEMDIKQPPIPTLLAVGSVHHHLIRAGLRTETSIVAETAQSFSTHHTAVLIGYGAHAVCPYLALETCRQWRMTPRTASLIKSGKLADISVEDTQRNYKRALEKGVLKILSKMGISLLSCYHGAQIFEIYGLGDEIVDTAFRGSVSRIGGLSFDDLQKEVESFWIKGFPSKDMTKLEDYGFVASRPRGEYHANNQQMAKLLHKAIGLGGKKAAPMEAYQAYENHQNNAPVAVLRDALRLEPVGPEIDLDEVEPAENIMKRFCTGGMSLGAISRETHETISIAMNRINGKSNSGEGGEDPVRWEHLDNIDKEGNSPTFPHLRGLQTGDTANSRIKQVASGRFGVTPQFLANADQMEIKIAQGAKPGEGGQLPGKKVSPYIANLRRSKPGVPLISPPPHHDIYSIEDLAQLIYDLHQVNPRSKVSVKLVAQAGIGTVASGVAKANADIIQISGHDGGTGASPLSSIKHAGGPMEMGLADAHQTLVMNELRERVTLRVDGGMRSGRDVLISAALGGDEFGFGTVAMIATGCIMARVCHTNNCPVGVASQREELRARFPGAPGDLVNFFAFVAQEVRMGLARLGMRSLDELVGRADLLHQKDDLQLGKTSGLDMSFLTTYAGHEPGDSTQRRNNKVHSNGACLDDEILADPEVQEAINNEGKVHRQFKIVNTDRATLGRIGGAIAKQHGDSGFAGQVSIDFEGSAGQSFGCFMVSGMKTRVVGEANDYVGKGMAGGDISIQPPADSAFDPQDASLVGNTCLYGATGGRLFVNGKAGERFAVRNSLAMAVVEGVGDHCCEYMTGGAVVCLGPAGRNVGAGMTGGLGYFYDEDQLLEQKVNSEIVAMQRVQTSAGETQLRELLEAHVEYTGSSRAKNILSDWKNNLGKFWQLVPPSEAGTPEVYASEDNVIKHEGSQTESVDPAPAKF
ncbi:TPA: Ferredoxin-dependent glutamate synthase 1, chloroplastic/mitochondrial [Trebouxia sp. C0005]